jgi:hypothetical protein
MLPEVSIMPFRTGWNTLEELCEFALAAGCTPAQFEEAVEMIGDDPHGVANYLQRYVLHRQSSNLQGQKRRAS